MQGGGEPHDLGDDQLSAVTGGNGRPDSTTFGTGMPGASNMSIPEMIMAIQIERGNVLDSQIKDQMTDMKERNDWLREANDALATLRTNLPPDQPGQEKSFGTMQHTAADGTVSTIPVDAWMIQNGIAVPDAGGDHRGTRAEFEAALANLKSSIDTVNSQSQMDMIRLQGLMDKRNQAFDMMTDTLSKTGKSLDNIVGNMR